jgi:diguanylate cyclase (GGDEF)-like protein
VGIVAERLRMKVAACKIAHPDGPEAVVTISIGCATSRDQGHKDGAAAFLDDVDRALYRAKAMGRNTIA